MINKAQLIALGQQAPQGLFGWSDFVAQTEFLWQDTTLIPNAAAWQRQWFELEIINGLALAEWDEAGRPQDWSARWQEVHQQEAGELVQALLKLL